MSLFLKIPLRWKLLCLLLFISLAPLTFTSYLESKNTLKLGTDLAEATREALTRETSLSLRQWIDDKAADVARRRYGLERTLRGQAREVERCLAIPSPLNQKFYYSKDLDQDVAISGVHFSKKYQRFDPNVSTYTAVPVTYEHAVFHLAPSTSVKKVESDIMRLIPMREAYDFLRQIDPDLIFWQYTALENGISCSYPGHGSDPSQFDPRTRSWYVSAKQQQALVYEGPYVDASTRELVLTLSMPVVSKKVFRGVTGIDIRVNDLARNLQLPSGWPTDATTMLVSLTQRDGQPSLKVLSRPGYETQGESWNDDFKGYWLEFSGENSQKLIQNMKEGRSGMDILMHQGKPCLWGYSPVHERIFLLAIIPYDAVILDAVMAQQNAISNTESQLNRIQVSFLVIMIIVLMLGFFLAQFVTRPIQQLVKGVRNVALGDLETKVSIRTHDELEELGAAFNQMLPQLQDRLRIKHSLDLARDVQQQLLPSAPPVAVGFDIAGQSLYCDETGGDYFDYLKYSLNHRPQLGIVIGDITGHGIAAAMLMATARSLLRADAHEFKSLARLMTHVNAELSADVKEGRFMTLFYLMLDPQNKTVSWASAGHDPAFRYQSTSRQFSDLEGAGLPLAVDPMHAYSEYGPLTLEKGDTIVMGTDGIWEARNSDGERFGKDALRDVIRQNADRSASEIMAAITTAVASFRNGHPQEDDLTLIVVKAVD
jgi:phosphoserine phosphatase RsbU/P